MDGFGSDSVRLVRDLRRDAQQPVQFLLFSATFNERIKNYALRVAADNGNEEVNQVSHRLERWEWSRMGRQLSSVFLDTVF